MPLGMLLMTCLRRGLDPGEPPYERSALVGLLNADDEESDYRPVEIPAAPLGPREARLHVEAFARRVAAARSYCLCGCGERPAPETGSRFVDSHQYRVAAIRRRLRNGLIEWSDLPESFQAYIAGLPPESDDPDPDPDMDPDEDESEAL